MEKDDGQKKRYAFLSISQIICAIVVLLHHSKPDRVVTDALWYNLFFKIVGGGGGLLHVVLATFMFTSGVLATISLGSKNMTFKECFFKRARRLLIPYFAINTILFIPKYFLNVYMEAKTELTFPFFFSMIFTPRESICSYLWFLPPLFVFGILSVPIHKWILNSDKKIPRIILLIASILMFYLPKCTNILSLNDIRIYFVFYYVGMLFGKKIAFFNGLKAIKLLLLGIACILLMIPKFLLQTSITFRMIFLLSGILLIYIVSIFLSKINKNKMPYLANKTFTLYIVAFPVQTVADVVTRHFALPIFLRVIIMAFLGFIVAVLVYNIMSALKPKFPAKCKYIFDLVGV